MGSEYRGVFKIQSPEKLHIQEWLFSKYENKWTSKMTQEQLLRRGSGSVRILQPFQMYYWNLAEFGKKSQPR